MKLATRITPSLTLCLLLAALSACGGSDNKQQQKQAEAPAQSGSAIFNRLGWEEFPGGEQINGVLGASVDTSGNITFKQKSLVPEYNFNFTFGSGLPGSPFSSNYIATTIGSAHKQIRILSPNITSTVQNVMWSDTLYPNMFGLEIAGYLAKPSQIEWPAGDTISYHGSAFQYVEENDSANPGETVTELLASAVTATLDVVSKKFTVLVDGKITQLEGLDSPLSEKMPADSFSEVLTLSQLDFSGDYLRYAVDGIEPNPKEFHNKFHMGFFGTHAQEFGGIAVIDDPKDSRIHRKIISFTLRKQ